MIAKFILIDLYRRPVFQFRAGNGYYTALLDTGAEIPVFTYGSTEMKELGGHFVGEGGTFKGFGGGRDVMVMFDPNSISDLYAP